MTLFSLFTISFLASTILPGGSEVYYSYLVINGEYSFFLLVLIATLGNTLGGFSNWLIGYAFNHYFCQDTQFEKKHLQAKKLIQKRGAPVLLLSWLPIIGDPLCLAAGLFKVPWLKSLLYIGIGKFFRYLILGLLWENKLLF